MNAVKPILRLANSPAGVAIDRWAVRLTGYSLVGWLFSIAAGTSYSRRWLVLTTVGAKTGRRRSVVLPYFPADGAWAVVGSKGGARSDPHWVHNLRASPRAWIAVDRRRLEVRARIAQGEERERLWSAITRRVGVYLDYQKRAAPREIPVVLLIASPE